MTEVQSAVYFSVIIDETADAAQVEQCAIVLRYVTEDYQVREELLGL